MKMLKKVSIIVPCYNAGQYLPDSISSILNQSFQRLELIIVDDGSTDDTKRTVFSFKDFDDRIQYFYIQHQGVAAARNLGLENATGTLIMFVDSDDFIKNDCVEKLYNALEQFDADISVCQIALVDEYKNDLPKERLADLEEDHVHIYDSNIWEQYMTTSMILGVSQCLMRKELLNGLKFEEGRFYESTSFMPKVIDRCRRIVKIPEIGYYYRQRIGSVTKSGLYYQDLVSGYWEVYHEFRTKYPEVCEKLRQFLESKERP